MEDEEEYECLLCDYKGNTREQMREHVGKEHKGIRIVDLGERKFFIIKTRKDHCIICHKDTKQDLIFVAEKVEHKLPIIVPPIAVWRKSVSGEFFAYFCTSCGYSYLETPSIDVQRQFLERKSDEKYKQKIKHIKIIEIEEGIDKFEGENGSIVYTWTPKE